MRYFVNKNNPIIIKERPIIEIRFKEVLPKNIIPPSKAKATSLACVESIAAISFEFFAIFLAYKNIDVARTPESSATSAVFII